MRYFNGFSLVGEQELFENYLISSDFTVAGFSYGAIKAVEYAFTCKKRIDTLQLFSPAFFNDRDAKFKKLQTLSFSKNPQQYCNLFLQNVQFPSHLCLEKYFQQGSLEELQELLHYQWSTEKLMTLKERGITIEVYVGETDAIINAHAIQTFFTPFATLYYFKRVGHILR